MRQYFKHFITVIITFTLVLINPVLSTSDEGHNEERYSFFLEGKEINALVNIQGGVYLQKGHPVGFHFDLLNRFARHQRCDIKIIPSQNQDPWISLIKGEIDIVVADAAKDTVPDQYSHLLISSLSLNSRDEVWVVRKEDYNMLQHMNYWFGFFSHTSDYKKMVSSYYRRYNHNRFTNVPVSVLSPYDSLIKQYSNQLGWDWRLLASLIYQESRFSISARSGRGAHGLMQVLSSTAKYFDIEDLYDPEQNIKAGTMQLKRLMNLYNSPEIDSLDRIKFTLAAYNAGEGRVEDIRRVAHYKQFDNNSWESAREAVAYMNGEHPLPSDIKRHGRFRGTETLNFVDQIISRYENYKHLVIE